MESVSMETAVRERYARGAVVPERALCCPAEKDPQLLEGIPGEVLERDYGCGDPARWVREGETVLDLGSGAGAACFVAARLVGPEGHVIGVDMTPDMLEVARRAAPAVAEHLGYANVKFRRGRIQDLALDLELLDAELAGRPIRDVDGFLAAHECAEELRRTRPMIASASVDLVISDCVLNLVGPADKPRLFREIHRVLRPGGRAVISDIVSDEPVPGEIRRDPDLWSGCIAGALTEDGFLEAFQDAGFQGIRILERGRDAWRTVHGIEFRSATVEAFKGEEGPCLERYQAVIYRGPFREVLDDDGHRMERGKRHAVCDRTFRLFTREPYREHFYFVEPREEVPPERADPFDCARDALRHPRETKGAGYRATGEAAGSCCGPGTSC